MKKPVLILLLFFNFISPYSQSQVTETKEEHNQRMKWWRDSRFGMFIHWGIYSIPAGEWGGNRNYAEWIRNQAEIPIDEYDKLVSQFNPVRFNAFEWVKNAKDAGMKYIIITSKHHDGFCLFDSDYTDYDIMSTPFKRDILKELSEECRRQGIKLGFYYSIMDWHHPDYLPRRDWEKDRSEEGADLENYIQYMKNQLKELLTNYGEIAVLWFDGEWESTWNDDRGRDLYYYVRSLQPQIIINNRISPSRAGFDGFTNEGGFAADFGTPEQQVPAAGLPGVDWESCMTMNDHWGFNKYDKNWKSAENLIQILTDIASKGGNYLLNVGPTSEGIFPAESIEILGKIGDWMKVNGESIYGTGAGPFKNLSWGRCTQKKTGGNTRLYLHVFEWPEKGKLEVPGIYSEPVQTYLLSDENKTSLPAERKDNKLVISVPDEAPDEINTVIVFDFKGKPDISSPPVFEFIEKIFIDSLTVNIRSDRDNINIRYTTDGSIPTVKSHLYSAPVILTETAALTAVCFRDGKPVSGESREVFTKVIPEPSAEVGEVVPGIRYKYYEGQWDSLPDFGKITPMEEGIINNISLERKKSTNHFGFEFSGYIKIETKEIYSFYTASDDGSSLYINGKLVVENDGQHSIVEKKGTIALEKGFHHIKIVFFESSGGEDLKVYLKEQGKAKQLLQDNLLYCSE